MPKSKTVNSAHINHLGLVRGTFIGDGSLSVTAFSQNNKRFYESASVTLEEDTDKLIETLSNFQNQKIQVDFGLEEIDEWFSFGDVIVFVKPIYSGYPLG